MSAEKITVDDVKGSDVFDVAGFLQLIGVDETDSDTAAAALRGAGYKTKAYLLAARPESLEKAKVADPVIDIIIKYQQQNQQVST